jgi:hypothetical protein
MDLPKKTGTRIRTDVYSYFSRSGRLIHNIREIRLYIDKSNLVKIGVNLSCFAKNTDYPLASSFVC